MNITTENGITVLTPQEGKRLKCDSLVLEPNQPVYLGNSDIPDNWTEIDRIEEIVFKKGMPIIANKNGSTFAYDGEKILFDTDNYSGGIIFNDPVGKHRKQIEITYKSNVDVPLKVQINSWVSNETVLSACDDYMTVTLNIDIDLKIQTVELYVQTRNNEHITGCIEFDKICFVG